MENNLLVSIIVPLYNKGQYFERCFNSVVCQTYTNIECIIVEDCSTDSSLEIANNLIKNYTGNIKFVLIKHEQNGGPSTARNTGINHSGGEYIYFLDADDEITRDCIKLLVALAQKHNFVDLVQGNYLQEPYLHINDLKGTLPDFVKGNLEIKKKYFNQIPLSPCNKLIRKEFINKESLYFKNRLRVHEDDLWHFFVIKKIENFAFTDEYTYIYHIIPNSTMNNSTLFPSISGYLSVAEEMMCNLDIDILHKQIDEIYDRLENQRKRILSDERYSSLMPRCQMLLKKISKGYFILPLFLRKIKALDIIGMVKAIIRRILGKKLTEKIKSLRKNISS